MGTRPVARTRRSLWATPAVVVALGLALALILAACADDGGPPGDISSHTPSTASDLVPLPPTAEDFWPDKQGVLHFCAVPGEDADAPSEWCASEIWFDPRNQRARAEFRDRDGTLESLAVVDGDTYGEYDSFTSTVLTDRTLNGQTWLQWLGAPGAVVFHEAYLNRGIINATEATVDGVPVLKIELAVKGDDGTVEANRTVYLDKASHLPIRTETKRVSGSEGAPEETHTTTYRVLEWLAVEAVDPALFTLPDDLPPVTSTTTQTEMTVEEARAFLDFDIYWLGPAFQGLTLSSVRAYRRTSSIGPWTHRVDVAYSAPDTGERPLLQISASPAAMYEQPRVNADLTAGPLDREVSVAGTTAVVSMSGSSAQLQMQLADTVITINAATEDEAVVAGDALTKLN